MKAFCETKAEVSRRKSCMQTNRQVQPNLYDIHVTCKNKKHHLLPRSIRFVSVVSRAFILRNSYITRVIANP